MAEAQNTHHVTLTVAGVEYGLQIRNYTMRDISAFAPKIASGNLAYADGTIYQTLAQTDFSHGFGFRDMSDPTAYAYSGTGVDSRMSKLLMLATKTTDASTKDGGVSFNYAVKFAEHQGSVYVATDNGVYKWDGAEWDSTGLDSGVCHDLMSNGDVLFVTIDGDWARYYDGGTWYNAGAGEDSNFVDMEWMTIQGGYHWATDDDMAYLHYASSPNEKGGWQGGRKPTTTQAGTDPGAIPVSIEYIPINGIISFNNALYVGSENGLYYVGSDDVAYQTLNLQQEQHPYNFKTMAVWQGALFFSLKNSLCRMTGSTITDITPPTFEFDFPFKKHGNFRFLTPIGGCLCVIADEGQPVSRYGENYYGWGLYGAGSVRDALLVYDGVAWHKLWELGTDNVSVTAMNYMPVNDKLWIGLSDGTIKYIPTQSATHVPYADYETTSAPPSDSDHPHYLYTSRFDAGLTTVKKHYSQLTVKGIGITANTPVDVWYNADESGFEFLGTAIYSPLSTLTFPTGLTGKTIRFRLNLQTTSATATPIVEALILQYIPRPSTIYSYSMDIVIADKIKTLDGRMQRNVKGYDLYTHMMNSRASVSPVTFVDILGTSHSVYETELSWLSVRYDYEPGNPKEVEGTIRATFVVATNEGV